MNIQQAKKSSFTGRLSVLGKMRRRERGRYSACSDKNGKRSIRQRFVGTN